MTPHLSFTERLRGPRSRPFAKAWRVTDCKRRRRFDGLGEGGCSHMRTINKRKEKKKEEKNIKKQKNPRPSLSRRRSVITLSIDFGEKRLPFFYPPRSEPGHA